MTLIVDRGLDPLPEAIAGTCEQVSRIRNAGEVALLLQPSPMTHSPRPLIPFLASNCDSWALVFDFIPLHYPSVYANNPAALRVRSELRLRCIGTSRPSPTWSLMRCPRLTSVGF